jgi:hypothetical protein
VIRMAGIPTSQDPNCPVVIVCSECGPLGETKRMLAALRMLAHYHRHEVEARSEH